MRKIFVPSLVLLALAALTVAPGFTADMDQATETQVDLPVEEPLMTPAEDVEEPLMTPAKDSEIPDLHDLRQDTWEERIRQCEGWEAEEYCGPGCDCVITATNVFCFC